MNELHNKLYKRLKEEFDQNKLQIQKPLWDAEVLNQLEKTKFTGDYEITYVANSTNSGAIGGTVKLPDNYLMKDYKRYTLVDNDPLAEYDEIKAKETIKIIIENGEIVDDTNTSS